MITVKDLVKCVRAEFDSYRQGVFYYNITRETKTDRYVDGFGFVPEYHTYQFTIPENDIGNGTLNRTHRPIELMRWIRKAHADGTLIEIK